MDSIEIKTLIDVTNTRVIRLSQGSELAINQQRNFITLMQCIEMRSIVFYVDSPEIEMVSDLRQMGFGSNYKGKHKVWTFRFTTDRQLVYQSDDGNPIGNLIEDLHEVPIIKNLSETINIPKPIFDCKDSVLKNTQVRFISHK